MNSDCYFRIGHSHDICEDFAISGGQDDLSYAVISDGCSGSPYTDVGSRLLCLGMDYTLSLKSTRLPDKIHFVAINLAEHMVSVLQDMSRINTYCLDATLGYVYADDTHLKALLSGDGAIAARRKDGSKWCAIVDYLHSAPPYLNYGLDKERKEFFIEKTEGCPYTIDIFNGNEEMLLQETIEEKGMSVHSFIFPRDEYDIVAVMSDGIQTFQGPIDNITSKTFNDIPPQEIISKLLNVKSAKGEFIKRRCRRMIKNLCVKKGWRHLDDFSIAAIFDGDT